MKNKKLFLNLKDWFNTEENEKFIHTLKEIDKTNIVVFPSLPFLYLYKDIIEIGSQTSSEYNSGPRTGMISCEHLKYFNVNWTIINHKENKCKSIKEIKNKIEKANENNINPIICIDNPKEFNLKKITSSYKNLWIAYEPKKEISMKTMTKHINYIKNKIGDNKLIVGTNINKNNIKEYNNKYIDGLLISRAALNKEELCEIIKNCN